MQTKHYNRVRKWCPIAGCKAKAQKKLSNHLSSAHNLTSAERKRVLSSAKTDKGRGRLLAPGQRTLRKCFSNPAEPNPTPTTPKPTPTTPKTVPPEGAKSTRHFPKFAMVGEILKFKNWLQTVDGKRKSESTAEAIATDVSKYLKFARADKVDWDLLSNRIKLSQFCESLESVLGGSGKIQKLDSIDNALHYLQSQLQSIEPYDEAKCRRVMLTRE